MTSAAPAPTARLLLLRHGEVEDWARGRVCGRLDPALSARGRAQAKAAGGLVAAERPSSLVSSPSRRAVETAAAVAAATGLTPALEPRLHEIGFGRFEGLTFAEAEALDPGTWRAWMERPGAVRFPGGECWDEVRARALAALEAIASAHAGEAVAVVTHGGVIRALLSEALALPAERTFRMELGFGSLTIVRREPFGWMVEAANRLGPPAASLLAAPERVEDGAMRRTRTAKELEAAAAGRRPPPRAAPAPIQEPLAMLRRRGLEPRLSRPDLPFDPTLPPERLDAVVALLRHYAFRLFLRGAILHRAGFTPAEATRYVPAARARAMAEACVEAGLAARTGRGRYRLLHPARSFGGTLEWWLARELTERFGCEAASGVRSGAPGVGGDLDVVATCEGKLVYVEAKSSPPKHLTPEEIGAFLLRVRALRPDVTLFVVDTALRLADKVLPLFAEALARLGAPPLEPRRLFRETWALTPHLFLVNAKEELIENVGRALAEGLRALGPAPP